MVNHYETLGLSQDASSSQISAAYRNLAKIVHPDGGGDEFQFACLQESYDVLRDPEQRRTHDQELGANKPVDRKPLAAEVQTETASSWIMRELIEEAILCVVGGVIWIGANVVTQAIFGRTDPFFGIELSHIIVFLIWVPLLISLIYRRFKKHRRRT